MYSGCLMYFPAALAGVAQHSKKGNDKHNPGEPLHHARGKSMDHEDCIIRHLTDLGDMLRALESIGPFEASNEEAGNAVIDQVLTEVNALCWRALALSQKLHEDLAGAPLAPAAKLPEPEVQLKEDVADTYYDPGLAIYRCMTCDAPAHMGKCTPP
jgi:hypothetical protein